MATTSCCAFQSNPLPPSSTLTPLLSPRLSPQNNRWFSDRAGRRICLIASNAATAAACCLCAVAPTYWVYVALRASVGFAAAGLPIGSYLLSTEAVGPSRRGVAGLLTQVGDDHDNNAGDDDDDAMLMWSPALVTSLLVLPQGSPRGIAVVRAAEAGKKESQLLDAHVCASPTVGASHLLGTQACIADVLLHTSPLCCCIPARSWSITQEVRTGQGAGCKERVTLYKHALLGGYEDVTPSVHLPHEQVLMLAPGPRVQMPSHPATFHTTIIVVVYAIASPFTFLSHSPSPPEGRGGGMPPSVPPPRCTHSTHPNPTLQPPQSGSFPSWLPPSRTGATSTWRSAQSAPWVQ